MIKYSVFVPFTRPWMVDKWFERFNAMDIPRKESELVVYVDHHDRRLFEKIKGKIKDGWGYVKVYFSGLMPPVEFQAGGNKGRRPRHIIMRNKSQELIGDTKYVFLLEDDILSPVDAFPRLLETIKKDKKIGMVQGTQMDRWNVGCIWALKTKWKEGFGFVYQESIPFQDSGLVEIDGGGHYCCIMPTKLYKSVEFKRPPGFLTNIDLYWLWRIKQKGYKLFNDFSILCEHHTQTKVLIPSHNCPILKRYIENGEWWYEIIKNGVKIKETIE